MGGGTAEHGFPRFFRVGPLETRDPSELKTLVCTVDEVSSTRYDSPDSPRGTSYQVPSTKTLYIGLVLGRGNVSAGTGGILELGYGDDHVENSAAGPINTVAVLSMEFNVANEDFPTVECWVKVPGGKYPYIRFTGGGWSITAVGIEV